MLPNVLQPSATDHVPVLADRGAREPRRAAGGDRRRRDLRRRRPRRAARRRPPGPRQADRDRPRPDRARRTSSASRSARGVQSRLLRGDFGVVLPQLAANGVRADAILLDLGVSSMQLDRPERGFSYSVDAPLDMRMDTDAGPDAARDRERVARARARRRSSAATARSATRSRSRARSSAAARSSRSSGPGELVDTIKASIPAPARFGEGHPAKRVFQALRIAVNDELGSLEAALPGRARDAASRRPARGDLVPLARGPDRQAVPAREGARLHVPAGLPGLRVRPRARAARDRAPARSGRARPRSPRTRASASARLRAAVKA